MAEYTLTPNDLGPLQRVTGITIGGVRYFVGEGTITTDGEDWAGNCAPTGLPSVSSYFARVDTFGSDVATFPEPIDFLDYEPASTSDLDFMLGTWIENSSGNEIDTGTNTLKASGGCLTGPFAGTGFIHITDNPYDSTFGSYTQSNKWNGANHFTCLMVWYGTTTSQLNLDGTPSSKNQARRTR